MIKRLELFPLMSVTRLYLGMVAMLPWRYLECVIQGRDVSPLLELHAEASGLFWGSWERFGHLVAIERDMFYYRMMYGLGSVAGFIVCFPFAVMLKVWRWIKGV